MLCGGKTIDAGHGMRQDNWQVLRRKAKSDVLAPLGTVVMCRRTLMLTPKATKVTQRSVSAGVIMRRGHCLKVWTKKQHVVSLSSTEIELYAAVKIAWQGTWVYLAG